MKSTNILLVLIICIVIWRSTPKQKDQSLLDLRVAEAEKIVELQENRIRDVLLSVEKSEAVFEYWKQRVDRLTELSKTGSVPQKDVAAALYEMKIAEFNMQGSRIDLKEAKIDLELSKIRLKAAAIDPDDVTVYVEQRVKR